MNQQPKPHTPRGDRGIFKLLSFCMATLSVALLPLSPLFSESETDESIKPKTFWQQHGKVEDPATAPAIAEETLKAPAEPIPLTLENLRIPVQHGSLKKTYAAREPIIIHIQDAHANYEAQKHLAGILEYLIVTHNLSLVLVEGGSRNDSLSYMRSYAPLEKRKAVAEEFLKSGKISGENYLDLTTDHKFTVFGIEMPELYDENMEAFLSVEKVQPDALTAMEAFHKTVEILKGSLYPQSVKDLEIKELEVKTGRVTLAKHYQTLADEAATRKVPMGNGYPNLQAFLKASALEGKIDFKTVETERTRYLESLTKSLAKPQMDQLLKQSLELKGGLVTPSTFYGHLKEYLKTGDMVQFPMLAQYVEYLELFEGIDHAALFTEVENLSFAVKDNCFTDKSQRMLAQVAKDIDVLGDLLELKLTPDSYDYYNTHKQEFRPDRWADALRGLGLRLKPPQTFPLTPGPINAAMPAMTSFYEVARQRDSAMVENALKQIDEFKVPFAVLVAGGFHTPVFERLFKERKVSYAVVAPKVGKVTAEDTEKYHRVLKETYVPMSDKYRQKLGIPAPAAPRASKEKDTSQASATEKTKKKESLARVTEQ